MKFLAYFLIIWFISGCDHPESKEYERNQKVNVKVQDGGGEIDTTEESSINGTHNEVTNENLDDRNILKMENQNGVKYVWIEINEIRLKFIFDTGASSICISPAEATVLYRQGTLRKEDILDTEYFQDATGKISEGTKINLRNVKIGNMLLENIEATIIDNVNAPLLLGQSVLERFGKIEIDNENGQIIFK
jgi:aspartyl protease family protein